MQGPSWLAGLLAVIMIATAAYCASRLVIARARRRPDVRDVDLVRTVMGVAMAGMLASWLNPLPDRVWAVMFGAGAGWFGWQAWRGRRAAAAGDGAAAGAGAGAAAGDGAAAGAGAGAAAGDGRGRTATSGPRALSPRLAACCQIAMGVTMGYMLVLML